MVFLLDFLSGNSSQFQENGLAVLHCDSGINHGLISRAVGNSSRYYFSGSGLFHQVVKALTSFLENVHTAVR